MSWLMKLQNPPEKIPSDAPTLSPLLVDDKGETITTQRDWLRQRMVFRRKWLDLMGDFPEERCNLTPQVLETEDLGGFTRQLVRYMVEPEASADAYLLVPKKRHARLPAIVVFHRTDASHIQVPAGLAPPEEYHMGVHLVRRGYVVLSPRCFIFNGVFSDEGFTAEVMKMKVRHPRWMGMGRMVWDAMRAVDYLETLPFVDMERVGCIGHSLGGKEALFAAAFDERFKAVVSSDGGIGLKFSNWEDIWYLGPGIRKPGFSLENHQVLSLIAPRAFLLVAGEVDGDRSWPFIEAVMPIYSLLGVSEAVGMFNHRSGHRFPPEAQKVSYGWLDYWLRQKR